MTKYKEYKEKEDDQNILVKNTEIVGSFDPIISEDIVKAIEGFYKLHPELDKAALYKAAKKSFPPNEKEENLVRELIGNEISYYRPEEPWIQTYTGRRFNPINPVPEAIVIEDIAHALSMQCRFSGHINQFYSVSQHSVLVSYVCDSSEALHALLHDASEAYLVDLPRPIKKSGSLDNYLQFEERMERAIAKRFNIPDKMTPSVRMADDLLLSTEARDLLTPKRDDWQLLTEPLPFKIVPWSQPEAKRIFIRRYCQLTGLKETDIISKH